jgi:hypothetical protein
LQTSWIDPWRSSSTSSTFVEGTFVEGTFVEGTFVEAPEWSASAVASTGRSTTSKDFAFCPCRQVNKKPMRA